MEFGWRGEDVFVAAVDIVGTGVVSAEELIGRVGQLLEAAATGASTGEEVSVEESWCEKVLSGRKWRGCWRTKAN